MKICHVIYIPRFSGAEILVRNLAAQHRLQGHQVAVVAIMPSEASFAIVQHDLTQMGVCSNFPPRPLGKWERLKFLADALQTFSPDVVFAHAVIPSFYARFAAKLARLRHTPVVTVLHDASQDDYASPYFRLLENWLAPQPAAIVAVSPTSASNYRRRIRSKIDPQVIVNGVQLEAFDRAVSHRSTVRKNIFKVNDDQFVFLQVGRISRTKQQHHSLHAFAQAVKTFGLSGKLCFVGISEDSSYESELKQLTTQLEVADHVLFLDARSDIPELLAGADVYLMPSLFEAHSVAFIEALASGITIIASDIPSFRFGAAFPGVHLISPESIDEFMQAINQVTQPHTPQSSTFQPRIVRRWQRDLSDYSICKTANSYLETSKVLASAKA
jgi:glycosyltransferase involved in cell wall biosynthesis